MDIYELLKQGLTKEQIFDQYKSEFKKAKSQLAQDKKDAEAAVQAEALKAEARAHMVNGLLAYCEAFGVPVNEEDIPELEAELVNLERFIVNMMELKDKFDSEDFGEMLGLFGL